MFFAIVLVTVLCAPSLVSADCSALGTNLLTNASAETGAASDREGQAVEVPGWEVSGGGTVITYAPWDTLGPGPICDGLCSCPPLCPPLGEQLFLGGWGAEASQFTQTISIPEDCESQPLRILLSAWLGGSGESEDAAIVEVVATNSDGGVLETLSLGPVTAADRAGRTGTLYVESSTPLPPGTYNMIVTLHMTDSDGLSPTWGLADLLSVSLEEATGIARLTWSRAKGLYQ